MIGSDRRGRTFGDAADDADGQLPAGREAAGDGSVVGREPVGAVLGPSLITGPDGIFDGRVLEEGNKDDWFGSSLAEHDAQRTQFADPPRLLSSLLMLVPVFEAGLAWVGTRRRRACGGRA